jgi:hypothetical protein
VVFLSLPRIHGDNTYKYATPTTSQWPLGLGIFVKIRKPTITVLNGTRRLKR